MTYLKKRLEFGSTCFFAPDAVKLVYNLFPEKGLGANYIARNPVHKAIQDRCIFSCHEVNTYRPDFVDRGMNHSEGGWPKELNVFDEEAILRFKKKLEREDNYVASMKQLTKTLEHAVLQNNAVNIYEQYYSNVVKQFSVNESMFLIRNEFRDFGSEVGRPVSHLSWSPQSEPHFAVSYCDTTFQSAQQDCTEAYVWNVEIPNAPVRTFQPVSPIVNLEWNTLDNHLLVGGMVSGDIALFDSRKGPRHVSITPDVLRHRDPVHSVLWLNSKTAFDFFSTSSDGVVKWWDCRNLNRLVDVLILDLGKTQKMTQARSASCLEYDPTIPAKFMVGTEDGYVIAGNRKGVNVAEKLPFAIKTNLGPVYSIQRNQAFSKNFLTVGDWRARIWSDDCKESAILWTKSYKSPLVAGEWSKTRYSAFILARADGYLDFWDLLQDQTDPVLSMRVSEDPLTTLRFHSDGRLAIVGDSMGETKLVQFGSYLAASDKNDKANLSAIFDRETRREKILEARLREIKLAMKLKEEQLAAKQRETEHRGGAPDAEEEPNEEIVQAEKNYQRALLATKAAYLEATRKREEEERVTINEQIEEETPEEEKMTNEPQEEEPPEVN